MRKIIGYGILTLLFGGLLSFIIYVFGILAIAVIIGSFVIVISIGCLIGYAVFLIENKDEEDAVKEAKRIVNENY